MVPQISDISALLETLSAGSSGAWYAGLTRERVYQRFATSFCFRVEDEYMHAGRTIGIMAQVMSGGDQEPGTDTLTFRQYQKYYQRAEQKGMFPSESNL